MAHDIPPEWGTTNVTEYFELARMNIIATSQNKRQWFQKLERIDELYRKVITNLYNTKSMVPAFFLFRAHAGYLAAFQLASSGQLPESYAIMRNCIEASLYALYVEKENSASLIWLNRSDSAESKKSVRKAFQYSHVLSVLQIADKTLSNVVDTLYERLIDLGGHPNPHAILTNLEIERNPNKMDFKLNYLNPGEIEQDMAIKTLAQVGITCLSVFKHIWKERFDIMGISSEIEKEKPGL